MARRAGGPGRAPRGPSPPAVLLPRWRGRRRSSRARRAAPGCGGAWRATRPRRARRARLRRPAAGGVDRRGGRSLAFWGVARRAGGVAGRRGGLRHGDGEHAVGLCRDGAVQIGRVVHADQVLLARLEWLRRLDDEPVGRHGPLLQELSNLRRVHAGGGGIATDRDTGGWPGDRGRPRAPGAGAARCAVVSLARRNESASARALACSESYCALVNSPRTATGVVSGSANTRTRAVSSGRRGSSGAVNWMRQATESTGSTPRMRGPTVSCPNAHSTALALESTATVTESNASRRSSWRLLFWSW